MLLTDKSPVAAIAVEFVRDAEEIGEILLPILPVAIMLTIIMMATVMLATRNTNVSCESRVVFMTMYLLFEMCFVRGMRWTHEWISKNDKYS